MFSHIMVGSNDIERSKQFYDAVLAVLGCKGSRGNIAPTGQQRYFYRHGGSSFGITAPINSEPASVANGSTIGFACESAEQVKEFHDVAVANGGISIEQPPGLRQGSLGDMYLSYVRDPDGHKLCAMFVPRK